LLRGPAAERELKLRAKLSAPYEPSSHGLVGQALVVRALLGKKLVVDVFPHLTVTCEIDEHGHLLTLSSTTNRIPSITSPSQAYPKSSGTSLALASFEAAFHNV
ncbi:MAG: hypothetical protein QOE68_2077, partial [Thermoanaerobaculia bacterium]|nr:hypothetical protein [Thermoanaerobaculia bacterium]